MYAFIKQICPNDNMGRLNKKIFCSKKIEEVPLYEDIRGEKEHSSGETELGGELYMRREKMNRALGAKLGNALVEGSEQEMFYRQHRIFNLISGGQDKSEISREDWETFARQRQEGFKDGERVNVEGVLKFLGVKTEKIRGYMAAFDELDNLLKKQKK